MVIVYGLYIMFMAFNEKILSACGSGPNNKSDECVCFNCARPNPRFWWRSTPEDKKALESAVQVLVRASSGAKIIPEAEAVPLQSAFFSSL
jgi:hypothetical protein